MDHSEKTVEPIVIPIDDARGALGPQETNRGDTLIPMLVVGLTLVVVAINLVMFTV